jgi:hypothetical protein
MRKIKFFPLPSILRYMKVTVFITASKIFRPSPQQIRLSFQLNSIYKET